MHNDTMNKTTEFINLVNKFVDGTPDSFDELCTFCENNKNYLDSISRKAEGIFKNASQL